MENWDWKMVIQVTAISSLLVCMLYVVAKDIKGIFIAAFRAENEEASSSRSKELATDLTTNT